ncbi:LysM peptidoglycan-binding domain-containing protein [Streptomyces sp. KLMMK]|uniref:LysM peptidoglycan-binding domain-containing protein n=1 Tax=Streptomyces sp. KLMMK TaxID=3109353 RepID=UPI002FFEF2CF
MTYSPAEAIKQARKHLGYREKGENDTIFNREYGRIPGYPEGGYGYPWCQSFMSYVHRHAGGRKDIDYPYTVGCAVATAWFKRNGRWSSTPHVGDMVMYGPNGGTHVEMVTAVEPGRIRTIGGNTGGSINGAYYNGNGVYEKWVSRSSSKIHGYGRPKYQSSDQPSGGGGGGGTATGGKYKISKGQTLAGIAALLGVSLATLLALNPQIKNPNVVQPGQEINVPKQVEKPKPPTDKPKPKPKPKPSKPSSGTYKVKKGDTLGSIANRHGISLAQLLAWNPKYKANPNYIVVGDVVSVKGPAKQTSTPRPTPPPVTPKPTKPVVEQPSKHETHCECCGQLDGIKKELEEIKEAVKPKPTPEPTPPPTQDPTPEPPSKDPTPPAPVHPEQSKPTDIPVVPQQILPASEVALAP